MDNNVRQLRVTKRLTKAELARRAGISPLTLDRVEKGMPCQIATRRKILLALRLDLSEKDKVFSMRLRVSEQRKADERNGRG